MSSVNVAAVAIKLRKIVTRGVFATGVSPRSIAVVWRLPSWL